MPVETPARPEIVHRDFYDVLGVSHHSTEEAIRSAYRKLVLKWHPDRHRTNKEEKARRFMEAHEAFLVLTDRDSRAVYDGLYHPEDSPLLHSDMDLPPPPVPFSQEAHSQFETAPTHDQTETATAKLNPPETPVTPNQPDETQDDALDDANEEEDPEDATTPTNAAPSGAAPPASGKPTGVTETPVPEPVEEAKAETPADVEKPESPKDEPVPDAQKAVETGNDDAAKTPVTEQENAPVAAPDNQGANDPLSPSDLQPEPENDGVSPSTPPKAADPADVIDPAPAPVPASAPAAAAAAAEGAKNDDEDDKDSFDDDDEPLTDLSSLSDDKFDDLKTPIDGELPPLTPITAIPDAKEGPEKENEEIPSPGGGQGVDDDGGALEDKGDTSPVGDVEKDPSTPDTVKPAAPAGASTPVVDGEPGVPAEPPIETAEEAATKSPVETAENAAVTSPAKDENEAAGGDADVVSPMKELKEETGEGGSALETTEAEGGEPEVKADAEATPTTPNPPTDETPAPPEPNSDETVDGADAAADATNTPEPAPKTDAPEPASVPDAPDAADTAELEDPEPTPAEGDEGEDAAKIGADNGNTDAASPEEEGAKGVSPTAENKVDANAGDATTPASPNGETPKDQPPAEEVKEEKAESPMKTSPVDAQKPSEPADLALDDDAKGSPTEAPGPSAENTDESADAKTPTADNKTPTDEAQATVDAAGSPTDGVKTETQDEKPAEADTTVPPTSTPTADAVNTTAETPVGDGPEKADAAEPVGAVGAAVDEAKVADETPTPNDKDKPEAADPAATVIDATEDTGEPSVSDEQARTEAADPATPTGDDVGATVETSTPADQETGATDPAAAIADTAEVPAETSPDGQQQTEATGAASTAGDTTNDVSTSLTKDSEDNHGQDETQVTTPTQGHAPSPALSKNDIPASESTPTAEVPPASSIPVDSEPAPQASDSESKPKATPKRVTVRAPSPEANESALPSGAATPRPHSLYPGGIPESVLATPRDSGASTPWGRSIPSTPLSDTSNWNTRPQSSRARSAHNMMRRQEAESMKGDTTPGVRTPATVTGRGWPSAGDVTPGGPRSILKDRTKTAISPPPIPPITATSGAVPAEWVYPLHVPLETLYTGARLRYRVTRYLLSGETQESYVDIEVKPGWRKGTKIRFAGLGNERAPPLAPQDVLFVVDEVPHARFRREGANLFTTCDINLLDVLADTQHVIQGLDGNNIVVDVGSELAGGIIRPGDISRVVGMGMPVRKNSQVVGSGDLIIKWNIVFPDQLSMKQRRAISLAREEEVDNTTAPATPM